MSPPLCVSQGLGRPQGERLNTQVPVAAPAKRPEAFPRSCSRHSSCTQMADPGPHLRTEDAKCMEESTPAHVVGHGGVGGDVGCRHRAAAACSRCRGAAARFRNNRNSRGDVPLRPFSGWLPTLNRTPLSMSALCHVTEGGTNGGPARHARFRARNDGSHCHHFPLPREGPIELLFSQHHGTPRLSGRGPVAALMPASCPGGLRGYSHACVTVSTTMVSSRGNHIVSILRQFPMASRGQPENRQASHVK